MTDTSGVSSSTPAPSTSTPSSSTPSTPASTPSTPVSAEPASTPSLDSGDDFSSIFEESDSTDVVEVTPAVTPAVAPAAATPATPGAEPAAVAPVVAPAAPAQVTAPATSPTATPVPSSGPTLDPTDPLNVARAINENEAVTIEHVAKTLFALSPEDSRALEENPVELIPTLLARAYVKSQAALLSHMGKMIPQMIQRQATVTQRNGEAEGKFFTRWPDLKVDQHGPLVRAYAATYRGMHPQATLEQMIEQLGPIVMMAAKVVPGHAPAASAAPRGPMAPISGSPQAQPFVPGGAGVVSITPASDAGEFSWLDPSAG